MKKTNKQLALDFIICCYFGQSKHFVEGAINRAYIDMASHTMKLFDKDEVENKWKCRQKASNCIINAIRKYHGSASYDKWHSDLIEQIKRIYEEADKELTEGQAQKWLNMTIKYIYVFSVLFGKDDNRLLDAQNFLERTSVEDYHIPVDSYVLKAVDKDNIFAPWSQLDKYQYDDLILTLKEDKDFMWELEEWENLSERFKEINGKSYEAYLKRHSNC